MTVIELVERFTEHKSKTVYKRTLSKFKALYKSIDEFFGNKPAASITKIMLKIFGYGSANG